MSAIERFLIVARAYREATGLKETALSWRLFGDSKKLGRLGRGFDIQVTRYERAMQQLSDSWPLDIDWPAGIDRPPPAMATPVQPAPAQPEALSA